MKALAPLHVIPDQTRSIPFALFSIKDRNEVTSPCRRFSSSRNLDFDFYPNISAGSLTLIYAKDGREAVALFIPLKPDLSSPSSGESRANVAFFVFNVFAYVYCMLQAGESRGW